MMKKDGKVTIGGIILLLIIAYGAFAAVKLISASLMEAQIENEVVDDFGLMRGSGFTAEIAEKEIIDILMKNDVIFDPEEEDAVNVVIEKGKIIYRFRYTVEVDLIFFKKVKEIEVNNEMRNYG